MEEWVASRLRKTEKRARGKGEAFAFFHVSVKKKKEKKKYVIIIDSRLELKRVTTITLDNGVLLGFGFLGNR